MELPGKKTEALFEFFNSIAPTCVKCGKKYSCVAVRYFDLAIGIYSCDCQGDAKNLRIYRGIASDLWEKAKKIIGEKDLEELRTQERAAIGAEILCPRCGQPMKYRESAILPDGRVQHRFDCRNGFCPDFEKAIWTGIDEADYGKIFEKEEEKAKCRICRKTQGAKIHCPKEKGVICEEHCSRCEFHEYNTSKFICKYK